MFIGVLFIISHFHNNHKTMIIRSFSSMAPFFDDYSLGFCDMIIAIWMCFISSLHIAYFSSSSIYVNNIYLSFFASQIWWTISQSINLSYQQQRNRCICVCFRLSILYKFRVHSIVPWIMTFFFFFYILKWYKEMCGDGFANRPFCEISYCWLSRISWLFLTYFASRQRNIWQ